MLSSGWHNSCYFHWRTIISHHIRIWAPSLAKVDVCVLKNAHADLPSNLPRPNRIFVLLVACLHNESHHRMSFHVHIFGPMSNENSKKLCQMQYLVKSECSPNHKNFSCQRISNPSLRTCNDISTFNLCCCRSEITCIASRLRFRQTKAAHVVEPRK